jgi:radical SAM protein with 4Fe4S-binding SPASM domain
LKLTESGEKESSELVQFLFSEECLVDSPVKDAPKAYLVEEPVLPSLRYLQLHITERCNLNCAHCYLGEKRQKDLGIGLIEKALDEFSPNGLKVLITGGEPLLHRDFWQVLELASRYPVRIELLSNGTLITGEITKRLSEYVHTVQISLDGMKRGHELLRGKGSFEGAVQGIRNVSDFMSVNIATMVHSGNASEFEELEGFVSSLGSREWNLDIPSLAGNAKPEVLPHTNTAGRIFKEYGFGEGVHEGDADYSCGSHICTIDIDGNVSKCGFFDDGVGNIRRENLQNLWTRVVERYTPSLGSIKCRGCRVIEECRGGCRYRAMVSGDFLGRDPFMCSVHLGAADE